MQPLKCKSKQQHQSRQQGRSREPSKAAGQGAKENLFFMAPSWPLPWALPARGRAMCAATAARLGTGDAARAKDPGGVKPIKTEIPELPCKALVGGWGALLLQLCFRGAAPSWGGVTPAAPSPGRAGAAELLTSHIRRRFPLAITPDRQLASFGCSCAALPPATLPAGCTCSGFAHIYGLLLKLVTLCHVIPPKIPLRTKLRCETKSQKSRCS